MGSHDSADAFDALVQREFVSRSGGKQVQSSRTISLRQSYRQQGRRCSGYRGSDLLQAIGSTRQHLQRRGVWRDKNLVFKDLVDGTSYRLCPLVEYRPPRSKADRRLVRDQATTFISDSGLIVIIDQYGEYVIPTWDYWQDNYADRRAVWMLLWAVRRNY